MKISVLTPSFNSVKYIRKAIESVLGQSYTNSEHIIIDGNSNDGTIEILKEYPHLKWVSEPDKGQSDAMNKAFKLSTGDYIIYLNADDYFLEDAFKTYISVFEKNQGKDIIVGNLYIDRHGILEANMNSTISWKDLSVIKGRFPLNPVSYMYKRRVQEKIGDFPINEHYTMDYWFLLRAFYFFKPMKIEPLMGVFVFDGHNKTSKIIDGFNIQKPLALKFALRYTPHRFINVYLSLLTHNRNNSKISKFVKTILNKLRSALT